MFIEYPTLYMIHPSRINSKKIHNFDLLHSSLNLATQSLFLNVRFHNVNFLVCYQNVRIKIMLWHYLSLWVRHEVSLLKIWRWGVSLQLNSLLLITNWEALCPFNGVVAYTSTIFCLNSNLFNYTFIQQFQNLLIIPWNFSC